MALAAYRHVLRSTRIAFQGDARMLYAARHQARTAFDANRGLPSGSEEAAKGIHHAEDVARALRENVVQGVSDSPEGIYKLRIHEETERGDNDSVKNKGPGGVRDVKCEVG